MQDANEQSKTRKAFKYLGGKVLGKGTIEDLESAENNKTGIGKASFVAVGTVTGAVLGGLLLAPLGPLAIAVGVLGGMVLGSKGCQKFSSGIGKRSDERAFKGLKSAIKDSITKEQQKELEAAVETQKEKRQKRVKSTVTSVCVGAIGIALAVLFPPLAMVGVIAGIVGGGFAAYNVKEAVKEHKGIKKVKYRMLEKFANDQTKGAEVKEKVASQLKESHAEKIKAALGKEQDIKKALEGQISLGNIKKSLKNKGQGQAR